MCTTKEIPKEAAVAAVCETYHLNTSEFSDLLELLGCISPEQKSRILVFSTAWAVKDMIDNRSVAS